MGMIHRLVDGRIALIKSVIGSAPVNARRVSTSTVGRSHFQTITPVADKFDNQNSTSPFTTLGINSVNHSHHVRVMIRFEWRMFDLWYHAPACQISESELYHRQL